MKIIKFSAAWCQPCAAYKPVFDKVISTLGVPFECIDVEREPSVGGKYRVMSIPATIIIGNKGEELFRKNGPLTEEELTIEIKKHFNL